MSPDDNLQFPESMRNMFKLINELKTKKVEWRYKFMSDEVYSSLTDQVEAGRIYWEEMLTRAHIIALLSMFRTARWFESVENQGANYYGFCSSLRGLIESIADSYYTLQKFPLTIAVDFEVIRKQIGKTSIVLTTHEILENELLHFIQGTKFPGEMLRAVPKYYNAKKIIEYLAAISSDTRVVQVYDHLCSIAHPAFESARILLFLHEGETIVCNDSLELEKQMVVKLLKETSGTLEEISRIYMNNILSTVSLLNDFGITSIDTEISGEAEFKKSEIWTEIEMLKEQSIEKYRSAELNGKYE